MSHLIISKKNEVHLHIEAEAHVYYELSDQFTFEVPGAKFMPHYQKKTDQTVHNIHEFLHLCIDTPHSFLI